MMSLDYSLNYYIGSRIGWVAVKEIVKSWMCLCVFFPFILDIKFVGRTSRGHTGGRSHRILLRKASEVRVDRRLRRYYLIVLLLPNIFALACLPLSSI